MRLTGKIQAHVVWISNPFDVFARHLMKFRLTLLLIFLMLLLVGCSVPMIAADTLPWVSEESLLFKDDFHYQQGGWSTLEDPLSFAGYDQGGFRLQTDMPNYQVWSVPGLQFRNTQIVTRAQKLAGPEDNLFGILCRYQDNSHFYAFVISSDGYYGIYERAGEHLTLINQVHMDFSEAINRGEAINDLQAICVEDQLALFVNDTLLLQVQDDTLAYGDVGMMVGNFTQGGVDILFDYFFVVKR
jgi:hypothetical protein